MKIKPLKWVQTSRREITCNGKPIVTETWEARNAFAVYKVYRSVGGRCFVILPTSSQDRSGYPGFYSGADELMGKPKTPCKSIDDGKRIAEQNWKKLLSSVLE